jgi:thymidylate kinase
VRVSQPLILVVTGPAGVGKSTVSRAVASSLEASVHLRMDDFTRFGVSGWVEPWLPDAVHQNMVVGGAVLAAAIDFARGGYGVLIDSCILPGALDELTQALPPSVPLHYVILRCDLETCWGRAARRDPAEHLDRERFAQLHARFDGLAEHERHVVEATGTSDEVVGVVLAALRSGTFAARGHSAAP